MGGEGEIDVGFFYILYKGVVIFGKLLDDEDEEVRLKVVEFWDKMEWFRSLEGR